MDWPHQTYAVQEAACKIAEGARRICITSPTGMGKGLIMQRLFEWGMPTVAYINRTILFEQMANRLDGAGLPFGLMASGYAPSVFSECQLAMMQTVSRRFRRKKELPHQAELVVIDEWHAENSDRSREILQWHYDQGAIIIGLTATPVGLKNAADELIVAGKVSDGRKCGALVHCKAYAPDEPDMRAFKSKARTILQYKDEARDVMLPVICGRVIKYFNLINPEHKPSVLFAPGVEESKWFAGQLEEAGISAAHIDGDKIILNGEVLPSNSANRERLRLSSESGETKVVCNRFVLRTGVDWPHLAHGILACNFGSLVPYVQSIGRLLRNHKSLDGFVTLQDHSGAYHAHGSANLDREWFLDDDEKAVQERHDKKYKEKTEPEPIVCPRCARVRSSGVSCPQCGFAYSGRKRIVIQTDGTLREQRGDVYHKPRASTVPAEQKVWQSCYWRCFKAGMTFSQARGLFQQSAHGCVPAADWPLVPRHDSDWTLRVCDVPMSRLNGGKVAPSING